MRIAHAVTMVLLGASIAAAAPPRNNGPEAAARTRVWRHRRSTVRMIRRTPEVMREDAARVTRGDLFGSWSAAAAN